MRRFDGVVAVDGPSGSGKSTVCRRAAIELAAHYLDTGAMYRAVTFAVLQAGIALDDSAEIAKTARAITLASRTDPTGPSIKVDGVTVDTQIRSAAVTGAVSAVAAVPEVRKLLVGWQQAIIASARADVGERRGIVVEGRDIGTVVAPDAVLKVYLTASEAARAARRHAELGGASTDQASTQADLARRDHLDSSRTADPLTVAPDAVVVDTTDVGVDDAVARVLELVDKAVGVQP